MTKISKQKVPSLLDLPVYLDNQSTTATDPQVLDKMIPFFHAKPGNPHSDGHQFGKEAMEAVDVARRQVANIVGGDPREIIFTSGATESNNLAIKGAAQFQKSKRKQIITTQTEHKCVLETCRYLETIGHNVLFLPVKNNGLLDLQTLASTINSDTLLVSVMAAHNEIGVLQDIEKIGALCRQHGALFHTDAAQAVGKIPLDVNSMNIDLMSISGHKLYGPKGIGALYLRRRPRVRIIPQIEGGGQERGMRSCTLSTPLCVGLGEACRIASRNLSSEPAQLRKLRDRLYQGIKASAPNIVVHGDMEARLPGNLNISFSNIDSDKLMSAIPEVAFSSGSACTSNSIEPSYVIRALGRTKNEARGAVRFGIGRFTTVEEIDYVTNRIIDAVDSLKTH